MDKEYVLNNVTSYSALRGLTDRYSLTDKLLWIDKGNYVICTDTEEYIDRGVNVCLVTDKEDCIHIGTVPQVEDGYFKGGKNRVKISNTEDSLVFKYGVFYDNDHHHSGEEVETIDITFSDKHKSEILKNRCIADLFVNVKAKDFQNQIVRTNYHNTKGGFDLTVSVKHKDVWRQGRFGSYLSSVGYSESFSVHFLVDNNTGVTVSPDIKYYNSKKPPETDDLVSLLEKNISVSFKKMQEIVDDTVQKFNEDYETDVQYDREND